MGMHTEAFEEARKRCCDRVRNTVEHWVKKIYAYDSGFWDGWNEAMMVKFDDRPILAKWAHASKHVFCPCTEEERCNHNCPHGLMIMSGVCTWCSEKFEEMEKELNA